MGEVGVDPERLAELASALEQLRDTLAANVPVIVNTLNSYWSGGTGSPVNLGALQHALGRAPGDAADMRARARLAALWEQQKVSLTSNGMMNIPFSGQALDNADARAQAQALADAEASGNPKAVRAAIQVIQQDLQDQLDALNHGDAASRAEAKAFLTAFYNQAAPQVANLALLLHNEDASGQLNQNNKFTVLTQADQRILATYGQGLAAADKAGLSPAAVQAIVRTPNVWSAAMLVKYGPSGSSYATAEVNPVTGKQDAPSLLAQLTEKVYADERNGTLEIPMGDGQRFYADDFTSYQNAIADFEPFTTMLQADAQNRAAAWQVLGGPDGAGIAKQLLSEGVVPGGGNVVYGYPIELTAGKAPAGVIAMPAMGSGATMPQDMVTINNTVPASVVAEFLNAATSAGRGAGNVNDPINPYRLSAQAAVNIIMNTPPAWFDGSTPQPSFDPVVEQALTSTFLRYLPDIAFSSASQPGKPHVGAFKDLATGQTGGWQFAMPPADFSNFLQQLSSTPQNYGFIKGAVSSAAGTALAMQLKDAGQNGTAPYTDLTTLYGTLIKENNQLKYEGGQLEDANHAQLNAEISFAENFIKDIPVVGQAASTALSWDQQMSALGFPQIPQFSTDNAAAQAAAGAQVMSEAEMTAMVPLVQGLAQGNITVYLKPYGPSGPTEEINVAQEGAKEGWYQNGKVIANGAFWQWWQHREGTWVKDQSAPTPTSHQLSSILMQWQNGMQLGSSNVSQPGGS